VSRLYEDQGWLYDAAFDWDISGEVTWLLDRLGAGRPGFPVRSILEPFCGSGRMFVELARRGVEVGGVDLSPAMLERARQRMRREGLPEPPLLPADAADFDFGRAFDGAICPINSFGYLPDKASAARHLACVSRHLRPGGHYLVQLDLRSRHSPPQGEPADQGRWEVEAPSGRIAVAWFIRDYDPATRMETHVARFDLLTGPRAGERIEEEHKMRRWDHKEWSALVAASGFDQEEAFDGNLAERPRLSLGPELEERPLVWHQLRKR
jgi:SAM-dependent methyltransferase